MGLYRPTYRDRKTGELKKSRVWWLEYERNGERHRVSLEVRDRRIAESRKADFLRDLELEAAGIVDPFKEHRARPIEEHLDDFEDVLRARGNTKRYVDERVGFLDDFVEHSGAQYVTQLNSAHASRWLESLRVERDLSARSLNKRRSALRQFGKWLVRERRYDHNPFLALQPQNERVDRRRVRRALTQEELARLLQAARERPLAAAKNERVRKGVTGAEEARLRQRGAVRALAYELGAVTGLRREELKAIRRCDVDLERCVIRVPAKTAKSKRDQVVTLDGAVSKSLEAHLAVSPKAGSTDLVFPPRSFPNMRTFKRDLKHAGIPYEDEEGRVVDFHAATRTTLATHLAQDARVHPRTAQKIMRHSSIELTMQTYTDPRLIDTKSAVEGVRERRRLGGIPGGPSVTKGQKCAPARTNTRRTDHRANAARSPEKSDSAGKRGGSGEPLRSIPTTASARGVGVHAGRVRRRGNAGDRA